MICFNQLFQNLHKCIEIMVQAGCICTEWGLANVLLFTEIIMRSPPLPLDGRG